MRTAAWPFVLRAHSKTINLIAIVAGTDTISTLLLVHAKLAKLNATLAKMILNAKRNGRMLSYQQTKLMGVSDQICQIQLSAEAARMDLK